MSSDLNPAFADITTRLAREIRKPDSKNGVCPRAARCNYINLKVSDLVLGPTTEAANYLNKICHGFYEACELNQQKTQENGAP